MNGYLDVIKDKLSEKDYFSLLKFSEITGYGTIETPPEIILDICKDLRDQCGFELLIDIVGVDRASEDKRFEVIYNLWSIEKKQRIFLKVKLDSAKPEIESVTAIWTTANWEEREAYDMFGIIFLHHPDLRRIYMRDDYEYYPLRKDYPLMGLPGAVELPKK